jgi:hypothetical protein
MTTYELNNGIGWSPDDRSYQEPTPPPTFQAPPVAAAATKSEGTVLEQAQAAFSHARKEFQKHLDATHADEKLYTREGLQHQIDAFQSTDAARSVDAAEQQVAARRDQAKADLDRVYRSLSPDCDAAGESRAARFWHRSERLLDSLQESGQKFATAKELIDTASREELGTLLQELPSYLRSVGVPTDWIDDAVGQAVPEYASARGKLTKAESALQFARLNADSLRRAFKRGNATGIAFSDPFDNPIGGRGKYDPDM